MTTNETKKLRLTCNHAASSYGVPVLVDELGNAYGPADAIPLARGLKCTGRDALSGLSPILHYDDGSVPAHSVVVDVSESDDFDPLEPGKRTELEIRFLR